MRDAQAASALTIADLPPPLLSLHILAKLSPHSLSICSCVCKSWRHTVTDARWAQLFAELWSLPADSSEEQLTPPTWQRLYAARQLASRCWLGRPALDKLMGLSDAVKACCLLQQHGLVFAGGMDRTVRAWDLRAGTHLAASRRHGGTVRCLAADASLLASGSSDHAVRVWRRCAAAGAALFDLEGERSVLAGHAGPVSCLLLTPQALISGSWDCSIRLWHRRTLGCTQLLHTDDWVSAMALGGGLVAAACGRELLLCRMEGAALRRTGSLTFPSLGGSGGGGATAAHAASLTAVAVSCDGRSVFAGTADGGVWLAHVPPPARDGCGGSSQAGRPMLLQRQASEVSGLSWEHPWLAVADRGGGVALLHVGAATAAGAAALEGKAAAAAGPVGRKGGKKGRQERGPGPPAAAGQARVLHPSGSGGGGAQCVALCGGWAAAGLDCGSLLTWDGSRGLQQQAAAAAARMHKAQRRQRNQERQRQQQQCHRPAGAASVSPASAEAAASNQTQAPPAVSVAADAATSAEHIAACSSRVSALEAGQPQQSQAAAGSRARPQPGPRPIAAAASPPLGGTCRQAWKVLRPARAGTPSAGESPQAVAST